MTVIAWDGKTLAADRMLNCNDYPASVTKIRRAADGSLFGGSGESDVLREIALWYETGSAPELFPPRAREKDSSSRLLVITAGGKAHLYLRSPVPIEVEDKFFAIGSGTDFALAAMYLGKDAAGAVGVACALDVNCGNGIDTLEL